LAGYRLCQGVTQAMPMLASGAKQTGSTAVPRHDRAKIVMPRKLLNMLALCRHNKVFSYKPETFSRNFRKPLFLSYVSFSRYKLILAWRYTDLVQ
jgi:hypothetical protein